MWPNPRKSLEKTKTMSQIVFNDPFWYEPTSATYSALTDEMVEWNGRHLGVTFPSLLIGLLRRLNGGCPHTPSFNLPGNVIEAHVGLRSSKYIQEIFGIHPNVAKANGQGWSDHKDWADHLEYRPPDGIILFALLGSDRDFLSLDYRMCGPHGEPAIVVYDSEPQGGAVIPVAASLSEFLPTLFSSETHDVYGIKSGLSQDEVGKHLFSLFNGTQRSGRNKLVDFFFHIGHWGRVQGSYYLYAPRPECASASVSVHKNRKGYYRYPDSYECIWLFKTSVHPKHRNEVKELLDRSGLDYRPLFFVDWTKWRQRLPGGEVLSSLE
jgi:hypothetical protein